VPEMAWTAIRNDVDILTARIKGCELVGGHSQAPRARPEPGLGISGIERLRHEFVIECGLGAAVSLTVCQ